MLKYYNSSTNYLLFYTEGSMGKRRAGVFLLRELWQT